MIQFDAKITSVQPLNKEYNLIELYAPKLAEKSRPGQLILTDLNPEKIRTINPIVKWNREDGKILVAHRGDIRRSSKILVSGPVGKPIKIKRYGNVIGLAEGHYSVILYPRLKALRDAGNNIIAILEGTKSEPPLLDSWFLKLCRKVYFVSPDGSRGIKSEANQFLKQIIDQNVGLIYSIGTAEFMWESTNIASKLKIPIRIAVITEMLDGFGQCGTCRITVAEETKLICMDGPDFSGTEVDFREIKQKYKLSGW